MKCKMLKIFTVCEIKVEFGDCEYELINGVCVIYSVHDRVFFPSATLSVTGKHVLNF